MYLTRYFSFNSFHWNLAGYIQPILLSSITKQENNKILELQESIEESTKEVDDEKSFFQHFSTPLWSSKVQLNILYICCYI